MKKLYAYIDGFNLYKGMMDLKNNMPDYKPPPPVLKKYLWLNLDKFISSYFSKDYSLNHIYYFTSPFRDNPDLLRK
jgi:hypothetical protein